jgi:hypothetical protein
MWGRTPAERRSENGTGPLKSRGQPPFRTTAEPAGWAAGALTCLALALTGTAARAQPAARPYELPPPAVPVAAALQPAPLPGALPAGPGQPADETSAYVQLERQLEPPGPERLFGHLESERAMFARIRQEELQRGERSHTLPEEPVLSRQQYLGRRWPAQREVAEPAYVCYGRLLFEQKNLERYGWDLGAVTPILSAGKFFGDFVMSPYHAASDLCRCYDCNTGYCLPGDPVPLLLYPPEWSLTGAIAEGAAVGAVLVLFP